MPAMKGDGMANWGLVGLVLSSTVLVELIRVIAAGWEKRKRAKGQSKTHLDIALTSRHRWLTHSRKLTHDWWTQPRPDLPPEPDDPWPPTERD